MSRRATWRGLNELVDAKAQAKEMVRTLEALHKEHRGFGAKDIKGHAGRLVADVDEAAARLQEKFRQIMEDLEGHKARIEAMAEFLARHYALTKPRRGRKLS